MDEKKIVIVDDEVSILQIMETMISQIYDTAVVVAFESPLTALEHIRTYGVDILVTDITMPGMNGIELASLVKDLYPESKIFLMSGLSPQLNGVVIDGFLHKPFRRNEMEKKLNPSAQK